MKKRPNGLAPGADQTGASPPPGAGELDELTDDSIVAAQSAAHVPKPRTDVRTDEASIVIADEVLSVGPETTKPARDLAPYTEGQDPTVVIRRKDLQATPKKSGWGSLAIWGGAGAIAFGFGGILASMSGDGDDSSGTGVEVPAAEPPQAEPAVQAAAVEERPTKPAATAEEEPEESEPEETEVTQADDAGAAVSPSELPVAPVKPKIRRPRPVAPARPVQAAPAESDIPSGI